jgi:hypothetical protein
MITSFFKTNELNTIKYFLLYRFLINYEIGFQINKIQNFIAYFKLLSIK